MRSTASPTTRSSCSACRSRRRAARACWCGPDLDAAKTRARAHRGDPRVRGGARFFLDPRSVRRRAGPRGARRTTAGSRATTCSSTGTTSGYRDFDHYLESFTADKRKKAKRERRRVAEDGVTFETLLGTDLDRRGHRRDLRPASRHLPAARPRALPDARILPRDAAALGEHFMVKRARIGGETVAAAVFFWSHEALYGRYWGATRAAPQPAFRDCAITRASSSASSAASRASSPARRASTR